MLELSYVESYNTVVLYVIVCHIMDMPHTSLIKYKYVYSPAHDVEGKVGNSSSYIRACMYFEMF